MLTIPVGKLKNFNGAGEDFSIQGCLNPKDYGYGEFELIQPLTVKCRVENLAGVLNVSGYFKAKVLVKCDRCQEAFMLPAEGDFNEDYTPNPPLDYSGEREIHPYCGDRLDISQQLLQRIFLLLPVKLLCQESCLGLCQSCGINLNKEVCSCTRDNIDPRLEKLKDFVLNGSKKGV